MRRRGGSPGERGSGFPQYLALAVLAMVVVAGLVTAGLPGHVGTGARSVVCRVAGGDDCATGARPAPGRPGGTPIARAGAQAVGGGCHGFWGCLGHDTGTFLGGMGAEARDMADQLGGLAAGMFTHPVDTGSGVVRGVWHQSMNPYAQVVKQCPTGRASDAQGCAHGLMCLLSTAQCMLLDSVANPGVMRDLQGGSYVHGAGRATTEVLAWVLPAKFPKGLAGVTEVGAVRDASPAMRAADDALRQAREARGSGPHLMPGKVWSMLDRYRALTPEQKAAYLDELTDRELHDFYGSVNRQARYDIVANASPRALRRLRPNPPGWAHAGNWYWYTGKLFDGAPKVGDIRQGKLPNCWCLSSMGADAERNPARIARMFKQNPNHTYTVGFPDGTKVTVTGELPEGGARPLTAGWPAILEKAYAERDYGGYGAITADDPARALGELTHGQVYAKRAPRLADIAAADRRGDAIVLDIGRTGGIAHAARRGIMGRHAYTVLSVDERTGRVHLADPYGPHPGGIWLEKYELPSRQIRITYARP